MTQIPKPPVVVILGHVDHGKTTLIDFLRKSRVTEKEFGGITQNIAAYEISHNGHSLTFIDTPGHEAFTALRSRGSRIADIAVLLVAGDEGIKPQAKEAIAFITESNLPLVVAVNKIDRPQADINRVKGELAEAGIGVEGFGGEVPCMPISAKTGQGVPELLDMILLLRDLREMRYDPDASAEGFVLEGAKDPRKGIVAIFIVQNGTLRIGDEVYTDPAGFGGKIKRIELATGASAASVIPSAPIIVFGLGRLPPGGARWTTDPNLFQVPASSSAVASVLGDPTGEVIKVSLWAGDSGGLSALRKLLGEVGEEKKTAFQVLHEQVGAFSSTDIQDAKARGITIVCFGVKIPAALARDAAQHKVPIVEEQLIFKLKEKLTERLEVLRKGVEERIRVAVLKVFSQKRTKVTVGGRIEEGTVLLKRTLALYREDKRVAYGKVTTIERDKQEVTSAPPGTVCAFVLEGNNLNELKEGDELVSA